MFGNSMKLAVLALTTAVYGQSCSVAGNTSVIALTGDPVGTETVVNGGKLLCTWLGSMLVIKTGPLYIEKLTLLFFFCSDLLHLRARGPE